MKTFREFLDEVENILFVQDEQELDEETDARRRARTKREENIRRATAQLTKKEKYRLSRKRDRAKQIGGEMHHNTEVSRSAREMRGMSPGDILRYKRSQRRQNRYHGDDPRNMVVADASSIDQFSPYKPGFHHKAFHDFEKNNRRELRSIENILPQARAHRVLINQARRRKRRLPDLQARMAGGVKRNQADITMAQLRQEKDTKGIKKILDNL